MQPRYVTLTSTGSTPWQLVNWHTTPQQVSIAVITASGSSFAISVTYEDPTGVYPSPNSSSPTAFTLLSAGSSSQFVVVPSSMTPIAAWQGTLNASSATGSKCIFVVNQAGIG